LTSLPLTASRELLPPFRELLPQSIRRPRLSFSRQDVVIFYKSFTARIMNLIELASCQLQPDDRSLLSSIHTNSSAFGWFAAGFLLASLH